ncbi:MAG: hypothetical protein ACRD0Z_01975 [Acidimicrobiales bacterium]
MGRSGLWERLAGNRPASEAADGYSHDGQGDRHTHAHQGCADQHGDGHAHEHGHSHDPAGELLPGRPSSGVFVDVGDGVGALVVFGSPSLLGDEIEIFPAGQPSVRQHVWMLEREVAGGTVCAAVFPSLAEGRYSVCGEKGGEPTHDVEVVGGIVTEDRSR